MSRDVLERCLVPIAIHNPERENGEYGFGHALVDDTPSLPRRVVQELRRMGRLEAVWSARGGQLYVQRWDEWKKAL